ncbi:MAG: sodium:proton antiporter [Firmicutes bacterium HGW-Firmicutes-16]|nr:MAG: sodium:proton antiporter [Firmicutes bacterium HGW-Firmicutes-16]
MLETVILGLFIAGLISCVGLGLSIFYALFFGLALFFAYGLIKKHRFTEMLGMTFSGIKTVLTVTLVFIMIGGLTAIWRSAGTIPYIIFYASKVILPQTFILATFILCCCISMLMGTSFGTAATMGVICMMMGKAMGVSPVWIGGAVLAGGFFGDRNSPMSTSALLVSKLTDTDIFSNVRIMIKSAIVPLIITCVLYLVVGFVMKTGGSSSDTVSLFEEHFNLMWVTVIPAALIIVLSAFKVSVKITVAVSIVCGAIICIAVQGTGFLPMLKILVMGYSNPNKELGAMLNGGGIVSMLKPAAIVVLSSSYSGIFEGTGLLSGVKKYIHIIALKINPFGAYILTSIFTSMISCNQSLSIMLTHQLCDDTMETKDDKALSLENSAVIIAPLIPWCIAGAVPLAAIGAPTASILTACYLYILPIFYYITRFKKQEAELKNAKEINN